MHAATQQFVEDLKALTDVASIQQTLERYLGRLGFDKFAYLVIRRALGPSVPLVITSYPPEWAQRYHDQNYINADDVVARAAQTLLPFDWYNVDRKRPQQGRIFNEAGDFGIRNGITVPVHGPANELSFLCVSSDATRKEFAGMATEYCADLLYAAMNYHTAVSNQVRIQGDDSGAFSLSPRERECLLWTARGKSTWEIGEILRLSSETVLFHLKNAMRKAGVYSKHHAVVKAIILGLIVP